MISIIVAVAENGVIGDNNRLLWHISEDLRRFKRITTGHPVVMGRKTWESLGRPLPGRENVVVTRRELSFDGARTVHSLDEAYALFPPEEEVFVIGGAQIYGGALPAADRFYLTRVHRAYALSGVGRRRVAARRERVVPLRRTVRVSLHVRDLRTEAVGRRAFFVKPDLFGLCRGEKWTKEINHFIKPSAEPNSVRALPKREMEE